MRVERGVVSDECGVTIRAVVALKYIRVYSFHLCHLCAIIDSHCIGFNF